MLEIQRLINKQAIPAIAMIVREATQEDHDAVIALMQHLQPDDPELSRAASLPIFTEITNSTHFIITVAEKSNTIIGSCFINIIPNLTRRASPYGVIENVVTHPENRRQGVGKALINHALSLAKFRCRTI